MASWSRTKRDTKLRHTPILQTTVTIIYEALQKIKAFFKKIPLLCIRPWERFDPPQHFS